ncbi:MAG: DegT/DnrJ/EryC1/StrS family aminotransferase [Rhodospirillales bacterium]
MTDGNAIALVDLKAQYDALRPEIDARIQKVLDHGQFIMGPEVTELEAALADFTGAAHAVAVSSGTDALLAALMAIGAGPGNAVYLPAFTFPATTEVVVLLGASPVFVDIDPDTYNMDPVALEDAVRRSATSGNLTPKAVIPVDLFGLPADYPRIAEIAAAHGMTVIADGAQSIGAALNGRCVGTLADITTASFFPAKPLGCYGDGGAVLTDDDAVAGILRSIRAHGKGDGKYDIVRLGLNARLDTLQAAILLAKLGVFADEIARREQVAATYDAMLPNAVTRPARVAGAQSAWAQYTIRAADRDGLATGLAADGIPTAVYYPRPMHLQAPYASYGGGEGSMPVSERAAAEVLSLPMHPYLTEDDIARICSSIGERVAR